MKKTTKTKNLFILKIDGALISIKCMYYLKTKYIGIVTFRKPEQIKHNKELPSFIINKRATVCSILKQHSDNMQHDPNRLPTERIFDIIEGINYER